MPFLLGIPEPENIYVLELILFFLNEVLEQIFSLPGFFLMLKHWLSFFVGSSA